MLRQNGGGGAVEKKASAIRIMSLKRPTIARFKGPVSDKSVEELGDLATAILD
ncbi:MAG: hypothetical protein ISS79_06810 [Phycisphaerae bacterium]|nr:hypothetical protein [Phycisphaerae bacterium]